MKTLHLDILTPEKEVFGGDVQSVTVPGRKGVFTVLPMHAPIISSLGSGSVTYVDTDGKEQKVEVEKGFVEVNSDNVTVCVELHSEI